MEIKQCRSCQSDRLIPILTMGDQYLSDFREDDLLPQKFPLDLVLCEECYLLQLKNSVPSSLLYTENYGYRSGINGTIRSNLEEIVKEVQALIPMHPTDVVVDIGANDGTLLSYYDKSLYRIGFEPIRKLAQQCQLQADRVIQNFFSCIQGVSAKAITAISMFYDLEDPNFFLENIKKTLEKGGIFVIQQNYLVDMLRLNAFDNIVHEHLEYYSLYSLEILLNKQDLEVFRVSKTSINGGSFRTLICRKGERIIEDSVFQMRKEEALLKLHDRKIYLDFARKVDAEISLLVSFLEQQKTLGKKIYVYGASTRGNSLLQFAGINRNFISAAVERNQEKIGKKIASLQIPILSEEEARNQRPDYMLVLPWFFREEFLEREKEYLERGGVFIFPLPVFSTVGTLEIQSVLNSLSSS